MKAPAITSTLASAVLGPPGRQRLTVTLSLIGVVVYVVFAMVQEAEVRLGLIDQAASDALTLFNLTGGAAFYLALRFGLNRQWPSDPALAIPQSVFALTSIGWSYGITGPARGAVIVILMLVLLFGAFGLRPRHARIQALYGFTVLATVMIYKGWTDPAAYDPRVEAVHFFFAVIIIVSVHVLTVRLNGLRQRLSQQKRDLQEAFERIQLLATRDELTGLLNRRAMMELLGAEARRVQRGGGPMALVLVDIDHFKAVNDTHGHSCGDKVLAGFAAQAEGALRASDVLARWGGEEFLLLMPATGVEQALVGVQRVRERLAHHAFDDVVPGLSVTFSAGLTLCLGESDLTAAIERADQALYRAKSGGRNRTECA